MDMLRQVRIEFELANLKWIKENETFHSEYGKKRIRIWKDKQLLQWHVKWRDEISEKSGMLLDRMIRTKAGDPFFLCDQGWVSIHDEIEEPFQLDDKENIMGRLIGTILVVGLKQSDDCQRFKKSEGLRLTTAYDEINQLQHIDPIAKLVLERSYFEAKSRIRKAHILRDRTHPLKLPILTSLSKLTNAKHVFSNLFWICGAEHPIKGYGPLRELLEEWYGRFGETSTKKLLNAIDRYFSLKGNQGKLLLSECLVPYEFQTTINKLSASNNDAETTIIMENFFKDWDVARNIVLLLSNWIEKEGEEVEAR